jgi:hypothetical protein
MVKNKNALRKHYVQEYTPGQDEPGNEWLELAEGITAINDDTEETTEETAYYNGDGTPEQEVVSVAGAYSVEGHYYAEDPAQALIAGKKYKIGNGRKLWHRIVSSDGKKEWIGRATVTAIVAGSGEASAYETFSCNIRFDHIPEENDLTSEAPGGGVEG